MDIAIVSQDTMKHPRRWSEYLRPKMREMKNGDEIMIILRREEIIDGLFKAWYRLCENKDRKARTRQLSHELGTTVWLWYE